MVEDLRKAVAKRRNLAGKGSEAFRHVELPPFEEGVSEVGEIGLEFGIVEDCAAPAADRLDLELRDALREAFEYMVACGLGAALDFFGDA